MNNHFKSNAQISFGVFADCQYSNHEPAIKRYYKNSIEKLNFSINTFNKNSELSFVVGLGDLIDKDFESFDVIQPILDQCIHPVYQVIGNHDLSVENKWLEKVPQKLRLTNSYYSLQENDWRFIFLNGSEITFQSTNPEIVNKAKKITEELTTKNKPNNKEWNGGMSDVQLNWLDDQLKKAQAKNEKAVIFCHYPVLPLEAHALWNSEIVLELIDKYSCVKLYLNGHNHAGNYTTKKGVHFLTLQGMVDTETKNSFAIISLDAKKIRIDGFGREPDRILNID